MGTEKGLKVHEGGCTAAGSTTSVEKPVNKPAKPDNKPAKPDNKPAKPEEKPEEKPEVKPETKPETKPKPSGGDDVICAKPSKEKKECVAQWSKCGGKGYNGNTECCDGSICEELNAWYFQCKPKPKDATSTCAHYHGQCGGKNFHGDTCCQVGQCLMKSEWFSACNDECPSKRWKCWC